ncbi:MAG TPA: hypothetical protein VNU97_00875 [Rhizomicrobium sp.]|jgi:hypothetical protein|nr:hypothetical protein [Rhizomicrobium sp.]
MPAARLKSFAYRYDAGAGPLSREELAAEAFSQGNCRLAVQYFLFKAFGLYLGAADILLPRAYDETGVFLFREAPIDFGALRCGDILYAENLRNRLEQPLARGREAFPDRDGWVLHFHSAVFLGERSAALSRLLPEGDYPHGEPLIWHATAIEQGSCVWPLAKFLHYYKPVSAKRVVAA